MANLIEKDLGMVTAYAYAKSQGYLGTEEDFAREQADFAKNASQVSKDKEAVNTAKTQVDSSVADFNLKKADFDNSINKFAQDSANAVEAVNTAKTQGIQEVTGLKDATVKEIQTVATSNIEKVKSEGTAQTTLVTQKGTAQVDAVNAKGVEQLDAITLKGTEQIELVKNEGIARVKSVTDEGAKQVQAVGAKGTEQVNAVTAEGNKQIKILVDAGGSLENTLTNYFNLRRTGKVFSSKFYKYSKSQSPTGEKLNANVGMICEPSTDTVAGRDDYQNFGLFQHFTCNYEVDPQGYIHITALEGDKNFKKTGEVFVGEVTCSGWVGVEDFPDSFIVHYSDKKTDRTPFPMKESINPDGTVNPWMVHAKYLAVDVAGKPYSSAGECPANNNQLHNVNTSYNAQIAWHHKHGNQYCGLTMADMFYRQLMLLIKYATENSQSVLAGCTGYSSQYVVAKAETSVKRVVLTTSQAKNFVVGSYVSIGDNSDASKAPDRYNSTCHNLAYDVKILSIEDLLDGNSAINLELDVPITTTATTWVSTFHWRTGSTDCVLGSDGSPNSNTDYKNPCKIQGIEYSLGGYEVCANAIMDIVDNSGTPMRDVYVCLNAPDLSTDINIIRQKYKKAKTQIPYTNGSWKYISELDIDANLGMMVIKETNASGSSTGFCDGLYTDTATSGQREFLFVGALGNGSLAGLFFLHANIGLGGTYWYSLAGVSPNGIRGEYRA